MKTSHILLAVGAVATIAGGTYAYREYNRGVADTAGEDAKSTVTAEVLVAEFAADENAANTRYVGQVVEVSGTVKSIEGNTVTLAAGGPDDLVTCAFGSAPAARAATPVKIKGEVSGSMTLMGTEVQLVRCAIVE
jgi:hypothetical protein